MVALDEAALSRRFLASLEDSAKVGREVSSLVSQAKNVFRKMSRRGFVPDADPDVVQGFVAGTQALLEIKKQIQTFKARLEHLILPQNDWTLQLEADRTIFLAQFHLLYGDAR